MFRRSLTTAFAAVALAAAMAAPAHADPNPPPTSTTITVRGLTTGVFLNGLQLSATCEAEVVGLVAATVIDKCWIEENRVPGPNHPSAAPGNATASTFTQQVFTLEFELCFGAYTIPLHNPTQLVRADGCATFPLGPTGPIMIGEATTTA